MAAWLRYDWCSSLVLALGHFLWQGVLLAALLAVVLKATKNVAVRYWLSLSALLLMAACPVATLAWLAEPASPVEIPEVVDVIAEPLEPTPLVTQSLSGPDAPDLPMPIEVESSPSIPAVVPEAATSMPVDQRSWWQRFAPQLTTAYASGVGLMLLRLAVGLWGGRRLCRRAIPVTDGSLLSALQRQSDALGLKLQPLLAYCERVTVPTVVGVLKPMILLPVSIASGLSPEQIESVLAHELAHLRRYDHLVNLLQRVIESLLFFHPAVWWVSHRVREEREHCCDDLVIACGAMPLDYAKSLLRVAELSRASRLGRSISAISLLATGDKPSNLRQRIARLLGESATPSLRLSPRVLMFALCAPVIALLASLQSGASNALPDKPQEAEVAKDLTPRPESYVAALANGMRVEFVGLAAMEPDAKNWWKPDGSPLNEVPAHDNATSSVSGRKMRRVLIRVHGKLSYLDVASQGMSTLRRRDDQDADGPFVRLDGGYSYLLGEKTGRIEVGIATQPQSAVRRLDAKGGAADGSPAAGGIKFDSVGLPALWISKSNGQEQPETAEQKKENDQRRVQTQVLWSAPKSLRTFDLDLTLIDVDGKAHQPAGRGSYFETDEARRQQINRGTFVFDVPISRVAGFEYRTRLYQHWVTFENVSLQRDELTDVTIKVESDASIESQPVVPQLTKNFSEVLTGQQADQVAWSHDSQQLYATGSFQKLTVWKRSESGWKPTTLDRESFKNSIAASQKSPLMVVGTNLGSAEVWDATTQKRLQLFRPSPEYSVYAVAISADDKLVAACGTNGTVSVFDRETQRPIMRLAEPDNARMASLAFSPDGKMLAAMDRYGYVALWTMPEGKPLAQWPKIAGEDCSVFWSRDSKQLAVSGWGSVTLIAAERGSQPKVVQAPEELLSRHPDDEDQSRSGPQPGGIKFASIPAISADLRTIASIAPDGNIGIWDVAHSGVIVKLQSPNAALVKDAPGGGLRHLTFSPDGLNLACTTQQGDVVIWQLAQNKMEAGKVQPGAAVDPEKATVDPTKPAAQPAATSAPPKGLEFLAPYPKLHGLSLDMTEPQFLEIVKQQELKTRKTGEGDTTAYHMGLGDGLTLIVMFRNDGTCRGIQRIRGEEQEKPPVIGAVIQLNPLPVVGDFSKVDDPDVLLDQLAKAPLPSLAPQSGGGFFQQDGAPPQAMYVSLWENQYAGNDKLDPRIRRLIELGDRAALRVLQRLNGLAASDALATHLTLVLRSAGTTESVPALIMLLKTSPTAPNDGTQNIDAFQKNFQASVTQVAATSALWKLTGRKHVFTPDQWEKWWQSVKPDFVVPRERQRPEFVSGVTLERVNSLANDLATNEVAARERLISLGPAALPHLLTLLATELPKPPLDSATLDAAKLSPQSKRLAWVIDELGATDKLPAKLRRDYFTQRFSDDGTYAGMYPIDEDALCRALSHCSFADYCSVFLEADSQGNVASHMKHIKWPLEIYAAYCRRFSKISPPNLGGWSNNAHWNKVVPAEDPAGEIESAVPILLVALKDDRVERRSSAAKLAAAIGFCSTAKPETLIVALRDAWLVDADEKVRPEIAFAMCRFQTPFVVKEVTNGMLSDRPEIVSDCAALMDWIPIQLNDETRAAFERLVELTRHENEKLRNRAVRSLRGKAVKLLNPELLRLSQDQSVDIRKECAYALRDKPDPKFADILFQLADDPNEQVRIEALGSIANLDHPESMKRLVPHLRDKKVQGYAVSALASMGGKDALPLLMSELDVGNDVGGMVYQHLRRLTGETFEGKPEPWLAWWKQQKAAPKPDKDPAASSLPDGLEFLRPYPKLHGLSLNMTEPQLLEIIKQQELKTRKTVSGQKVTHHIGLGDDHTLLVVFDKEGKCSGIQRVRGEKKTPEDVAAIQGVVLSVDENRGLAVISLGEADTVKNFLRFEVRAKALVRNSAVQPVVKGIVEVVHVEQNRSEVRIIKQNAANKIVEGDDVIPVLEKPSEFNGHAELRTLKKPAVLLPDHWIMQAVGFDNGGKELVTASNQSFITIRRWDIVGMKLISEIKLQGDKHGRAVHPRTFKLSGDRRQVVGATNAYVGIWDATTGKLLKQLPFAPKDGIYTCEIDQLDCTADLSLIVGHRAQVGRLTLSYDAHVLVWDGATGNVLQTVIDKGATDLKAIDLSTDGKRLVTTNGGGAKIWETSTGQLLRSIPNDNTGRKHSEPDVSSQYTSHVWSVQFSPDGQQVAMGDILGVKLLDTTSGKLLQQLEGPYRYSSSGSPGLVLSKDGQWLARLGTQEKVGVDGDKHRYVVPVWSTRTGARLFELHTEANDAAFSDDGQRLAVVFSDMQQALSVWTLSGDAANVEQTAGPGPHSRQDRVEENGHYVGKTAAEFIDKFKPVWGDTKHGLQYGIALTKPQRQFRSGERVPLVVFFRNTSDKPIKFNTAPDFFGNVPKVVNAQGEPIALENIPLLGRIPHYHEKLEPGEALGPFYLGFGLGENPRPGQQHWHPYFKTPAAGQYKLTHSVWINVVSPQDGEPVQRDEIVTGQIDFEIINGG